MRTIALSGIVETRKVRGLGQAGFDPTVPALVNDCPLLTFDPDKCVFDQAQDRLNWKYDELQQYWNSTQDSKVCSYESQIATSLKSAVKAYIDSATWTSDSSNFSWATLDQMISSKQGSFNAANGTGCSNSSASGQPCDPNTQWPMFGTCFTKTYVFYGLGAIIVLYVVMPLLTGLISPGRRR